MTYSKRGDWQRRARSFWRHLKLMVLVAVPAIVAAAAWKHVFHQFGPFFPKEDEIALTAIGVGVPLVPFGFMAVRLLDESYSRSKEFDKFIFEKNRNAFLRIRDDRLPVIFHLMQAVLMIPIGVVTLGFDYASVRAGEFIVWTVVATFAVYWVAITVLQNPERTPWFAERISKEWLTASVDDLLPPIEK